MHRLAITAVALALTFAAGVASASGPVAATASRADRCNSASGAQFRPEADLADIVERLGYRVERVGTDAGCYKVLAADQRGKRYDMRFEGTNLRMVSRYLARAEAEVVAQR